MSYESQVFKIPRESADYEECSTFVTNTIEEIIKNGSSTPGVDSAPSLEPR